MLKSRGFTAADVPNQSGKCFIVTGANSGIGFEITRVLAQRGARVLLACRDESKAHQAMVRIRQDTPHCDLNFLPIDFADLDSIRVAARRINSEERLDALINNAGVMTPPLMRTKQGFELQFGVNHLGCFALTSLLLPKLSATAGSRVVTTSSVAHFRAALDWDDINAERTYNRMQRYAASKLANALFFFELDKRLRESGSPIMSVGCHPGMASTNLGRYMGSLQLLNPVVKLMLNNAYRGAWPSLQAATGTVKPGGYYGPVGFLGIRGVSGESRRSVTAQDNELARRLWDLSVEMTGINPAFPVLTKQVETGK